MLDIFSSGTRALSWRTAIQAPLQPYQHKSTNPTSLSLPKENPGGSPLKYCNKSRATDLYETERTELYPKPLYM